MSLNGRWQGINAGARVAPRAMADRLLDNEIRRHEQQLVELLQKKRDVAVTITEHYKTLRRLRKEKTQRDERRGAA